MGMDLWSTWINNIESKKNEIVSTYEKKESALIRQLEKNVNAILALD